VAAARQLTGVFCVTASARFPDAWAFASTTPPPTYAEAMLHDGQHTGHAVDAYDTAALVHLADYKA
jgi:hypothetical protein